MLPEKIEAAFDIVFVQIAGLDDISEDLEGLLAELDDDEEISAEGLAMVASRHDHGVAQLREAVTVLRRVIQIRTMTFDDIVTVADAQIWMQGHPDSMITARWTDMLHDAECEGPSVGIDDLLGASEYLIATGGAAGEGL